MTHLLANTLIVSWKLNIQPTNYKLHSTPRYLVKVTKEYSWPFLTMSSSSISSVQFSCSVMSEHTRPPCPWPTPRAYSNSYLLSQWCHPAILASVVPLSCLQFFTASGSLFYSCPNTHGSPLQHSCLGNSMDTGAWQATVHGGHKESDTTLQPNHHQRHIGLWKLVVIQNNNCINKCENG